MLRVTMASTSGKVAEHLAYHPEVKGLSPTTTTGTGKEEMLKNLCIIK